MPVSLYNRLVQQRADLTSEATAILDTAQAQSRGLTDADRERLDAIEAERLVINRDIEREESARAAALALSPAPPAAGWRNPVQGIIEQPAFATMGEQLQAIALVGRGRDDGRTRERLINAVSGANEAVSSEGGFLLMPQFLGGIERQMYDTGELLRRVRQIEVGESANGIVIRRYVDNSRATGSRNGGVRGYWVDEGDTITDSKPTFERFELKLKKVAALGYASDELLEDVVAMNSMFPRDFADELTFLVEDAIYNGDGAAKPLGIVGHAAAISVAKETGQAAATVVSDNVRKMRARLLAKYRRNSVWLVNQEVEPQLEMMTMAIGTGGMPVFMPPGGMSQDSLSVLYGRPVIPVEYAAALGTVGDIMLVDLDQYAMIRKGGVKQASSMHVKFTTDEMTFRATYRCDGAPLLKSAITPFKGGDTHGPYVTLATRA